MTTHTTPKLERQRTARAGRTRPALGRRLGALAALVLGAGACNQTLDAGAGRPHGLLPVDERNPVVLSNDGYIDNWQGEYAVLLANRGGPKLAGIIVNSSVDWPDLQANISGWRELVAAARDSGLRDIPDPLTSVGATLVRPDDGNIDSTQPNRSEGALFLIETSKSLSLPYRPLVVVTGGRLTDVADAYLVDPTVVERLVVVSSLGSTTSSGGAMGKPNGQLDPWADAIVAARFRYIQVSAFYDQTADVPDTSVEQLPNNALGARLAAKRPNLYSWPGSSDQVGVLAVGVTGFVTEVRRVSPQGAVAADATTGPSLGEDPAGSGWLVTKCASQAATTRLWDLLLDPATFSP